MSDVKSKYTHPDVAKLPHEVCTFDRMWKYISENPKVLQGDYVVQVDDNGNVQKDSYGAPHKYEVKDITSSGLILASKVLTGNRRGAITAINVRYKISMDPNQIDKILLGDNIDYNPDEETNRIGKEKRKVSHANRKIAKRFSQEEAQKWMEAKKPGDIVWITYGNLIDIADYQYEIVSIKSKSYSAWNTGHLTQEQRLTMEIKSIGRKSVYTQSFTPSSLTTYWLSDIQPKRVTKT